MKTVFLDASRIMDRNAMYMYMNEIFRLPEYMGKSLDALHDALCEVQQDTEIICTHDCLEQINSSGYAFKALLVLGRCADENPHLHIRFR